MTESIDIVVAEDNLIQRTYLSRMIEKFGYTSIPAEDGLEALAKVKSSGAEILISDFHMPNLNGIELTREIRALNLDHYVHVIMITGRDQAQVRFEALEAGVDDFLTKGRDPAALRARIRAAVRLVQHNRILAEQHRVLKEANDRIQEDLQAAANAQRQLLPNIHKDMLGVRIASAFVPSAVVSGDMFGCHALNETHLGFYAVDVSGHGIHASLLSVAIGHLITAEYFSKLVLNDPAHPDPAALVDDLNKRFAASDNDDYFTMFCGVIDRETGRVTYCQAAYPSPFYVAPDGNTQPVGDGGFPVGMFLQAEYENGAMMFDKGGVLVICSDAAPEASDAQQTAFGDQRLRDTVGATYGAETDEIPEMVVQALDAWRDGRALDDDLTVVALKRT